MKLLYIFSLLIFLVSCSSTQQAYRTNVQIYLDSDVDVTLTDEEVNSVGIDLIYVKSGERPIATMALAFIEDGRYKWLSQDKAMLITESGRIVRTVGFDNDLEFVGNLAQDPLKKVGSDQSIKAWESVVDTSKKVLGALVSSEFSNISSESIEIHQHTFQATKVEENIVFNSSANGSSSWQNTYWFERNSGQLIKSSQKSSNNLERFEITYISRALRLFEVNQND